MGQSKKFAGLATAAIMAVGMGGLAACSDEDADGAVTDEEVDEIDESVEDADEELDDAEAEVEDEIEEGEAEVED